MQTLIINAHPDFLGVQHFSNQLQINFQDILKEKYPLNEYAILNLYEAFIPRIEDGQLLSIWEKRQNNIELTQEEKEIEEKSQALLNQFKKHHRIVIFSPLHNFNVTSRLKDYIDNILIARKTFRYTDTGSEGLMVDDYELLYIQASGSIYTNDDRYSALDISPKFLHGIFKEIMGFNKMHIVRVEGTAILDEQIVLEKARKDLIETMEVFYK